MLDLTNHGGRFGRVVGVLLGSLWLLVLLAAAPVLAQVVERETGEAYEWFHSGPTCQLSKSLLALPRALAGSLEKQQRKIDPIPLEEEKALGNTLARLIDDDEKWAVVKQGPVVDYLQGLLDALTVHIRRKGMDYRVYLLDSDMENAFCLPGGHVFVSRGLLTKQIENEAQLSSVLAHEIAHVDRGHTVALFQYVRQVLGQTGDSLAIHLRRFLELPYSHAYELEADFAGASLCIKAGYSPFQSVILLEKISSGTPVTASPPPLNDPFSLIGYVIQGGVEDLQSATSRHPFSHDRACRLKRGIYAKRERIGQREFVVAATRYRSICR